MPRNPQSFTVTVSARQAPTLFRALGIVAAARYNFARSEDEAEELGALAEQLRRQLRAKGAPEAAAAVVPGSV